MKHYRTLVAIILVGLMALSVYSLVSDANTKADKINELLKLEQKYENAKLYSRASDVYAQIVELDGGPKYYIEAMNMYLELGDVNNGHLWGDAALEKFPTDPKVYEVMLELYAKTEEFESAFKLLKEFDGRKLSSSAVEKIRDGLKYAHSMERMYYEDIYEWSGRFAKMRTDSDKYGLLAGKGRNGIAASYKKLGYFVNDVIAACTMEDEWYFINEDGENEYNISYSIKGNIEEVGCYSEGVFPVCIDGKYSYYDMDFKRVVSGTASYDYAGAFYNGVAAVCNDGKWELIDKNGKSVTGKTYQDILTDERGFCNSYKRIFVKENNKYTLINCEGQKIGSLTFDDAKAFFGDPYAAVKSGEKWGFIDIDGKYIINPKYENAESFGSGLAAVYEGLGWKYIDKSGKSCIEYEPNGFVECKSFCDDGIAFAKGETGWWKIRLYANKY